MELSPSYKVNVRRTGYIPGAMFGPFSFINIYSAQEVMGADQNVTKNMIEVAVTLRIVQLLYKECGSSSSKHKISIAVLSPYHAQVQTLQQKLERHYENNERFKVKVGFLHEYDVGDEVDVMIISTVGADVRDAACIELLRSRLNTNVYMTWARGSEFPLNWPAKTEIVQYIHSTSCGDGMLCVEDVNVRESLILMKFYSFSSGAVNSMISGCDGGGLGLPIELTEQEKDVVSFDKSSFILGRSGTGKSTVLTMKLFRNEQLHHLACEGFHEKMDSSNEEVKQDVLRQLFVTLSPRLCYAVKQHVDEFKRLTCGGSLSSQSTSARIDDIDKLMLPEDIPDHFLGLPHNKYPLIITFHRFLLMLDGTVGTSYFERFPCVKQSKTRSSRLVVLEQDMRLKDVTYERFCSTYWPHFNNKFTKNLDPSTVYTEIMSVIKGGLPAGRAPCSGILCKEDYVALCDARTSVFNAQKRETIYAIFVQYEKIKMEKGNFDLADLVNDLHERLRFEGYKGDSMDYVYIDEVQDLTMRQIMLFKYVCTNVHQGYAFSGDTAQTIAKGIGFRFEDIRMLFFSKFLLGSGKGKISKIFQLSENFRTHAAVLNLAQSVINLLSHFFPLFVDVLHPETSRIDGQIPILLETDSSDNAIKTIFRNNGNGCHQFNGFGAEQVVLVRDEYLKEKVVNIVGKNALVLTIMESKGLEFQDVLLYDFFTTSPFSNEWRIIYQYMNEKGHNLSSTALCACFDMEKHIVLCSELKQLYVAITRTRQRLWICETAGFSQPISSYWKKLSLVEVKHLNDSFVGKMQIPSSKDEWRSRGVNLFYENNYRMAHTCFMKAGDKRSERLTKAYHLRAIADATQYSLLERKKLFKEAAELFSSLGKHVLAAECFYEMEEYKIAGEEYVRVSMLEKAGNCFSLAKCYGRAVEEYEKAGAFSKCLIACTDGKLFEKGFQLIGRWGGGGDAELKFLQKGAHYYFGIKDFKSMMTFVSSFHSKDEMRGFLTKRRCFDELISLEVEWGNFQEAYAKCLLACADGKLFEKGFQLVVRWGGGGDAELKFLHKGAHYYFGITDLKSMMTFVRSFHSKDEMWEFLTKRRCFDELISLEVERDNFQEAYAVCLIACADGNLFEIGFQLIGRWGGGGDAELKFLQKGVHYYFGISDLKSMMTFVSSFHSEDEMRGFLKKRRCFDQLIFLEVEWGNYEEAAKVSRLKPVAHLLRMGEFHRESSLIILWHVFLKIPAFQNSGEPFTQKDELLKKAVSIANRGGSDEFRRFVCKEARILSEGKTQEESLKKGLEFIDCYKKNDLAVSLEHVKTTHEIEIIEEDVLDKLHSLLKSVNRLKEFLLLLEVRGKFVEAAKIVNEDDHSLEATLSRLWYVFFGSLWAFGKRAWPLKDFKQKIQLLHDINSYVECDPDSEDSALVRKEMSILSSTKMISLCEMWRNLSETPREGSLRIHFLISRRILDLYLHSDCSVINVSIETWVEDEKSKHLESELLNNIVSIEGLMYFWSYWKKLLEELLNWTSMRGEDSKIFEDFICNYFGVRKYDFGDKSGGYVVLNVEAQWVKQMNPCMRRDENLNIIHAHIFSSVASRYWCSELLFVAEKVLRKLQSLHAYSTVKNFSTHQQMQILKSLFEFAKSLQKWRFPNSLHRANRIVDQSFQLCLNEFMSNVFHINWKTAQSKEMISLRGNETFLNMLKESINMNSKSPKGLTSKQLGNIAMIFLGYKVIDFNDDIKTKVKEFSSLNWKDLFDKVTGDDLSSKNANLAISLHRVLKETLYAGWLRADDSMSPTCLLYLMERLLILSFCFCGYVFMTRSCCVDQWLTFEEWDKDSNGGRPVTCSDIIMKEIHHSLASMVGEMLNSKHDLLEWVTRSKEDQSYGILVLRLTVLLSMICINSGQHYHPLLDLLERPHFASVLPSTFAEGLIKGIKEDCLVDAVAVACQKIENPLVLVSFTKESSEAPCGNAIFMNMVEPDFSREKLIEILYQNPEIPPLSN